MKKILILCAGILAIGAGYIAYIWFCPEHYGRAFANVQAVSISQFVEKHIEGNVRIKGKIVRQCPVSGCWFYLVDGQGHQMKVEAGEVLPRLPRKIGHTAIVEGSRIKSAAEPTLAGVVVEFR